jgi:hypothetical protein
MSTPSSRSKLTFQVDTPSSIKPLSELVINEASKVHFTKSKHSKLPTAAQLAADCDTKVTIFLFIVYFFHIL